MRMDHYLLELDGIVVTHDGFVFHKTPSRDRGHTANISPFLVVGHWLLVNSPWSLVIGY